MSAGILLNYDVFSCITSFLALSEGVGTLALQRTYYSLSLTSRALRNLATEPLYRFPHLSLRTLPLFARTVAQYEPLASKVRGIAFAAAPDPALDEERTHEMVCTCFRVVTGQCPQLCSLATNMGSSWTRQEYGGERDGGQAADLFCAVFGRRFANRPGLHTSFRHLFLHGNQYSDFNDPWPDDLVRLGNTSTCSLNLMDLEFRERLCDLPLLPGPVTLRFSHCAIYEEHLSGLILRLQPVLLELQMHHSKPLFGGCYNEPPFPTASELRVLETDSLDWFCSPIPSLRELRLTAFDYTMPRRILDWLRKTTGTGMRIISLPTSYSHARRGHRLHDESSESQATLHEDVDALDRLCQERGISMRPKLITFAQALLSKITAEDAGAQLTDT